MKKSGFLPIIFAAFLLLAGVSFAGGEHEAKSAAGSGLNASYSKGDFDPKTETLPEGFLGRDIVEVFKAADALKGEHETIGAYTEGNRKRNASGPYAFTVEDRASIVFSPYNPRSRSLKLLLQLHSITTPSGSAAARWAVPIRDIDKKAESYIGCTKCGVQQKVTALFKDSYALAVLDPGRIVHDKRKGTALYTVTVKGVSPSEARALKESVALLVVCRPDTSFPGGPAPFRGESRVGWTVYNPVD
ncbi:MAG: hypothetical protein IT388_02010, partial [Nitrospirales bacterium]|nr:hypothetical protein [Nitrospirales bacterium]